MKEKDKKRNIELCFRKEESLTSFFPFVLFVCIMAMRVQKKRFCCKRQDPSLFSFSFLCFFYSVPFLFYFLFFFSSLFLSFLISLLYFLFLFFTLVVLWQWGFRFNRRGFVAEEYIFSSLTEWIGSKTLKEKESK